MELISGEGIVLDVGIVSGAMVFCSDRIHDGKPVVRRSPHDLLVFLAVPLLLSAVAVLVSYLPARRATKEDPMFALREM